MAIATGTYDITDYSGGGTEGALVIAHITPPNGTVTKINFSVKISCTRAGIIYFRIYKKNNSGYLQSAGISLSKGQTYDYIREYSDDELSTYLYYPFGEEQYYICVTGDINADFLDFSITATYNPPSTAQATATITSTSSTGTRSGQFSYSFSNCNSNFYYMYSTQENAWPISGWQSLGSNPNGTKYLTGLNPNTTYYIVIAGKINSNASASQTVLINGNTCVISSTNSFETDSESSVNIVTPPYITVSTSNLNATISVDTGSCSGTIWYSIITQSQFDAHGRYDSSTLEGYYHYGDSGSTSINPFTIQVSPGTYYFQVNMGYEGTYYYSNIPGPYTFSSPYATATITGLTLNSTNPSTMMNLSYNFTNCISNDNSLAFFYSKNSALPTTDNYFHSGSVFQPIEDEWYLFENQSSLSGTATIPGLTPGATYYVWIAGRPTTGSTAERSITISGVTCTYSLAATITTRPAVNVGDTITKAQMDSLRAYKKNIPIEVIQGDLIYTDYGNTYNNTLSSGISITANWFNNA